MAAVMTLRGVTKAFKTEPPVVPISGLDLDVQEGEITCVTGVSGKGKSTLLSIMGGLMSPDSGTVEMGGQNLYALPSAKLDELHRQGIGCIFQTPYLFQALTARENMQFALRVRSMKQDDAKIDALLEEFGLTDRADHLPSELSVGQRRRLVIAQAFLVDHSLLLADEPTNDLDRDWSDYVFGKFREFAQKPGCAVVLVTHDQSYAHRADTIYRLEDGKLVAV